MVNATLFCLFSVAFPFCTFHLAWSLPYFPPFHRLSFTHFIHSLTLQIFFRHLFCAKYYASCGGWSRWVTANKHRDSSWRTTYMFSWEGISSKHRSRRTVCPKRSVEKGKRTGVNTVGGSGWEWRHLVHSRGDLWIDTHTHTHTNLRCCFAQMG